VRWRRTLTFLPVWLAVQTSFAVTGADFAIYDGPGAWADGITAFEHFLDWKGVSHERVSYADVNSVELKDFYKAIFFPGGYAAYYVAYINEEGLRHIRDLVSSGGGYFGTCAGAYFASDSIVWEGDRIDYPLDLFQGLSVGSIHDLAPWPSYTMTTLRMNTSDRVCQYEPGTEVMLYYGGQYFVPYEGTSVDVLATWSDYHDERAIIRFDYGSGRVLLCGAHPEIEEDSDRDGTSFADELDDQGTDWYFLWSAIDWVLGRPISHPKFWINEFHYQNAGEDQGEFVEVVLPDWYEQPRNVRLTLYDEAGRSYGSYRISNFQVGSHVEDLQLYFLDIPSLVDGPGGLALDCNGELIQFLSYEGTLTAVDGPAAGFQSEDVAVRESESDPPGLSLQEQGDGTEVVDFTWAGPDPQTKGFANGDQGLPVELAAFSARFEAGQVVVRWTTANEHENLGFELLLANSPEGPFRLLTSYQLDRALRGAGTSARSHSYRVRCDVEPASGLWLKLVSVSATGEKRSFGPFPVGGGGSLPAQVELHQPWPNPARERATIEVRLPSAVVDLEVGVYDLRGRLVRRLWHGAAPAGRLSLSWSGRDGAGRLVPAGVYLVRLRAQGEERVVKLLVQR